MMEINDIKKYLYKVKPMAKLLYIRKGSAYYEAPGPEKEFLFKVPVEDMGDADYLPEMPAQQLIRYLLTAMSGTDLANW